MNQMTSITCKECGKVSGLPNEHWDVFICFTCGWELNNPENDEPEHSDEQEQQDFAQDGNFENMDGEDRL
tara:strand:+ start:103 stop:312 length:210 start_codon:yes stop_codon:yes gene_type:complete